MLRVWCMNDGALWSLCQHCWTGWMQTFVKHRSAVEIHRLSRYPYLIIDQLEMKAISCHLNLVEGFQNRCDPMTGAIRSTSSLSWTPKTLLFRINSWIVVQDLNYKQNEGPVYQDWAPSLETDQGRGFLVAGLCPAYDGSFVLTRQDKAKQHHCF